MEAMTEVLHFMLTLCGILGCVLALMGLALVGCWLLLRFADYWGVWMDTHPETEKRRG